MADFYLFTYNNDRHFPHTFGHLEHFIELFTVVGYINVSGFVSVSRPGFVCIGSTGFAINDYFVCHVCAPPLILDFGFWISDFGFNVINGNLRTAPKFCNLQSEIRIRLRSTTPLILA